MRLPVRRIATPVLCAGLLTGLCGAAVTAAEGAPPRERPAPTAPRAPLPDRDALRERTGALSGLGATLTPVAGLLDAVLAADDGRLPAADADRLAAAVRDALARTEGTLPEVSGNEAEGDGTPGGEAAPLAGDPTADAYAALRERIDALIKAATAGKPDEVGPAVKEVVAGTVDVVTATLAGKGLPAPELGLLPALPGVPQTPDVPETPGVPPAPEPADTSSADAS